MKATTNIHKAETITGTANRFDDQDQANTARAPETQVGAHGQGQSKGKPESELRAAARRHGLNLKELADRMGVNYGYLSSVASGRRPWTPMLRERAMAVLGKVPGQGFVYRQGGLVEGESTYIRERARELGLSLKELAQRVGVSVGYMSDVSRGRRNMSPAVQARVEKVLGGPVKVEPARCANRQDGRVKGKGETTYIRERAREMGLSLKGLAEHVGVSRGYMTQVSRGERHMSPAVQARVEEALNGPARIEPAQPRSVDPAITVGPDGSSSVQPERDGPAGGHQLRSSLPDHERPAKPLGGGPGEAARGAVPAYGGGVGGARRGQGDGLEEGRTQRRGGARRRWAGGRG